jgi:hypothetical protein
LLTVLGLHHEVLLRMARLVEVARSLRLKLVLVAILVVHVVIRTLLTRCASRLRRVLPLHWSVIATLEAGLEVDSGSRSCCLR